jgi:hypothetical protein
MVPPLKSTGAWPVSERRERRRLIEEWLLNAVSRREIRALAVARWPGISTETITRDLRRIRAAWRAEDSKRSEDRRIRVIRRMEDSARKLREAGDHRAAADVDYKIGRLLGMGPEVHRHTTVNLDQRQQTVVAVGIAGFQRAALDPEARAAALVLLRAIQTGRMAPGSTDTIQAPPKPSCEVSEAAENPAT